jgi:predicted nucleic acid-binding protein
MLVDTNLFVTAANPRDAACDRANQALQAAAQSQPRACISGQIIREFYTAVTRPIVVNGLGWTATEAVAAAENMIARFDFLPDTPDVATRLLWLAGKYGVSGKQIHDANIVATLLAHGEKKLLTLNTEDFARYADVIDIIQP